MVVYIFQFFSMMKSRENSESKLSLLQGTKKRQKYFKKNIKKNESKGKIICLEGKQKKRGNLVQNELSFYLYNYGYYCNPLRLCLVYERYKKKREIYNRFSYMDEKKF